MKERQSNIELLRIVATLMILMVHFSYWLLTFVDIDTYWYGSTSMAVTRATLNALTIIGVPLFVLISGYFSIKPKVCSLLNLFTCLAAYIFHTNKPIIGSMIQSDEFLLNTYNAGLYLCGTVGICVGVFMVAILLDKVRIWMCNPILDLVDKMIQNRSVR